MATLWTPTFGFKNKAGMLCMGHDNDNSLLKRAGKFETNFLQSMTRAHRCWCITNTLKSDHRLNMTLGTDITFTQLSIC